MILVNDEPTYKKFGACITLDHISLGDKWGGYPWALTILDRATGFRMAYPVKSQKPKGHGGQTQDACWYEKGEESIR